MVRNMTDEEVAQFNDTILERDEAVADLQRMLGKWRRKYKAPYASSVNLADGEFFVNNQPLAEPIYLDHDDLESIRELQERSDMANAEYNYIMVHLKRKCQVPFNARIDPLFRWVDGQGMPLVEPDVQLASPTPQMMPPSTTPTMYPGDEQ